jgi:hypothetical protein
MSGGVWILSDDLKEVQKISLAFRKFSVIPQVYSSKEHLETNLQHDKYDLLVLDAAFKMESELERTILLIKGGVDPEVYDIPSIGIIYKEIPYYWQIRAIMNRFGQVNFLKRDNFKF